MKLHRSAILGLTAGLALAASLAGTSLAHAANPRATPQPGGSCPKVGKTYTVEGRGTLTCEKVKGKLRWTAPDGSSSRSQGGSASGSQGGSASCKAPAGLVRSSAVPFGTRAPGFLISPEDHSYGSAAAIKAKGFNAVNTSFLIPYNTQGELDFSRYGGKAAWLCGLARGLASAKKAGLVVLVEGEVQAANAQRDVEPGPVPTALRAKLADQLTSLMPDLASLLEQYKVEYFAPLGESEKWLGVDVTQANYPKWVAATKQNYRGKVFAQLFTGILGQEAFGPLGITPNLTGLDALGIVFGDWKCSANSVAYTDAYVSAARSQGIGTILLSELGGSTKPTDAVAAQSCMQSVVDRYGARATGVLFMDNPRNMPGAQVVEGQWPERFVLGLKG
jgi:hypothetical protein